MPPTGATICWQEVMPLMAAHLTTGPKRSCSQIRYQLKNNKSPLEMDQILGGCRIQQTVPGISQTTVNSGEVKGFWTWNDSIGLFSKFSFVKAKNGKYPSGNVINHAAFYFIFHHQHWSTYKTSHSFINQKNTTETLTALVDVIVGTGITYSC